MHIFILIALILSATILPNSSKAESGKRIALLIGNSAYSASVGALENPIKDIDLLGSKFVEIGYSVRKVPNADRTAMLREINNFARDLRDAGDDAVGVLYYSGHGVSRPDYNTNYLIPIDVLKMQDKDIWWNAVSLEAIVSEIKITAPKASTFVIADACRNQLVVELKGGGKGFSRLSDENGIFIALATSPNMTASDEGKDAGPYARAFAAELSVPGQNHLMLFQHVKQRVFQATGGTQRPWESNGLLDPVFLNPNPAAKKIDEPAIALAEVGTTTKGSATQAMPLPPLKGEESSFCPDLKILADLSGQGFAALRAGPPDDDTWRSRFRFIGFDNCRIRKSDNISYGCYTNPSTNRALLSKSLEKFSRSAGSCLGKTWSLSRMKTELGDTIYFTDAVSNATISYSLFKFGAFLEQKQNKPSFYSSMQIYNSNFKEPDKLASRTTPLADLPKEYCSGVNAAIKSSASGFKDITGNKKYDETWDSKLQINGWDNCDVNKLSNDNDLKYLSCDFPQLQDADTVDRFIQNLSIDMKSCLGEDWSSRKREYSSGRIGFSFKSPNHPAEVEIRSAKSKSLWKAKLDINMR